MTDTLPVDELELPDTKPVEPDNPEPGGQLPEGKPIDPDNPEPGGQLPEGKPGPEPFAAMKTWQPYDRLFAVDLNSAFAYANHSGISLPGAICFNAGPLVALVAGAAAVEVKHGVPSVDPLGIYQAATGRPKIPANLGGVWLYAANYWVGTGGGGTVGAIAYVTLSVGGGPNEPMGTFPRWLGLPYPGCQGMTIKQMNDANELIVRMQAFTSDGVDAQVRSWTMIQLARAMGAYGT